MTRRIRPATPTLREVQQWMAASVLGPPPEASAALAPWLALPVGVRPAERLAIYAGGYPARLEDALREQFPAVAHLVGVRRFAALVQRYGGAARPASYNINAVGAELPAQLAVDPLAREYPFLADLAALEWCVVEAFHARHAASFDPASLAEWTLDEWAGARLCFQPSVAVRQSPWSLRALWEARATPIEAIDIDLAQPDHVLVYRRGFAVACASLDAAEARALTLLLDGARLGGAAAQLAGEGHDPAAVAPWFQRWSEMGLLCAVQRAA
ncbi:MAG: HvfC/BufC family peptide modification chaperone [Candidatus Binatia bacterium]